MSDQRKGSVSSTAAVVRELMTEAPAVLHTSHSLRAAQRLFADKRFRHLPVVQGRKLVGILSDRDIAAFLAKRPGGLDLEVGLAMTKDPIAVTPETTIAEATQRLLVGRFRCLPVVNELGVLIGIVTDTDLLRLLFRLVDGGGDLPREQPPGS